MWAISYIGFPDQRRPVGWLTLGASLVVVSCSGGELEVPPAVNPPPGRGSIRVQVSTAGSQLDPDGYRIVLDGVASQQVRVQDTVVFAAVTAGRHVLTVTGAAANCEAEDGALEKSLVLEANLVARIGFLIRCGAQWPAAKAR